MSATTIRHKRQTTLPQDVFDSAGLHIHDQIDWSFKDGEIRGRRLVPETVEVLELEDLDPKTLAPKQGKITRESIVKSVRADREGQR